MSTLGVDHSNGTPFQLLGDCGPLDDDNLHELYAYPSDLTRAWVRGNAISSVDGGSTIDGTSGGLGGFGDRRLFQVLRDLADVIVVGAGTVRAENYAGAQMSIRGRQTRQDRGQSEVPPLAVVTRSGNLDRDLAVLTHTEVVPLVLTCSAAAKTARAHLGSSAEVVECSGSDPADIDPAELLLALAERNLVRVLVEGGPTVMDTLIEQDLLDEFCVTYAPMLVAGSAKRIAAGPGHVIRRMTRAHLISDGDGYVYARYTRAS